MQLRHKLDAGKMVSETFYNLNKNNNLTVLLTLEFAFVSDAGLVKLFFYPILQAKTEKMDKTVSL